MGSKDVKISAITHIYLVRHGQSVGNVTFIPGGRPKTDPLTELGRDQAERVAKLLNEQQPKPEVVFSSPYTRALQTAEAIKENLTIPLFEDERLGEYYPGDWDGLHQDIFIEKFGKVPATERVTFRPPNGESWLDEAVRFEAAIQRTTQEGYDCAVFVSHYDPIKAVVNLLTKLKPDEWGYPVEYPSGSLTIMENENDKWTLIEKVYPR